MPGRWLILVCLLGCTKVDPVCADALERTQQIETLLGNVKLDLASLRQLASDVRMQTPREHANKECPAVPVCDCDSDDLTKALYRADTAEREAGYLSSEVTSMGDRVESCDLSLEETKNNYSTCLQEINDCHNDLH